jgi:hypothetical protein
MVDVDPAAEIAPAPTPPPMTPAATAPLVPMATPTPQPPPSRDASLVTAAPLGENNYGMSLGAGYSVILPLFVFEAGYGLSRRVDVAFRYETVAGVFHYPQLAIRWAMFELGAWTFGSRLGLNYSLFGVKSDQTNLTSTVYLSGELMGSRPVSKSTDLVFAVRGDFDLWDYRIVDGEKHAHGTYRYDATVFRVGARTRLTDDLSGYLIGNLRIPIETFQYKAQDFLVLPSIEVGGTFVW